MYSLKFPGAVVYLEIGYYGAYYSSMPAKLLERIQATRTCVEVKRFEHPIELQTAIDLLQGVWLTTSSRVRMDIHIALSFGQLSLINADFWVIAQKMTEVLLGWPLFKCIGMYLDVILTNL